MTPADDDEGGDDRTHPEERRPRANFCTRLESLDTDRAPNTADLYVRDREYFQLQTAHTMEEVASRWADDRHSERRRLQQTTEGVAGERAAPTLPTAPAVEEVAPQWADDGSERGATPTTRVPSPADQDKAAHSAVCAPSLATAGCCLGVWDFFLIAVERTDDPTTGIEHDDTGTAGTTREEKNESDDHTGQMLEGGGGIVDGGTGGTAAARTVPPARTTSRHGAPVGHHGVHRPTGAGRLKTRSSVTRDRRRVQHNLEELGAMARHGREEIERHMRATVARSVSPCDTQ